MQNTNQRGYRNSDEVKANLSSDISSWSDAVSDGALLEALDDGNSIASNHEVSISIDDKSLGFLHNFTSKKQKEKNTRSDFK